MSTPARGRTFTMLDAMRLRRSSVTATSTKCPPQCVLYFAFPFAMSTIPFLTMPDTTILYCAMAFLSEVCQTNFNHGFPVQRSAKVMHEEVIQPINFQTMFVWIRSLRRHHVVNQSKFLAIMVLWDKPPNYFFQFFFLFRNLLWIGTIFCLSTVERLVAFESAKCNQSYVSDLPLRGFQFHPRLVLVLARVHMWPVSFNCFS